MVSREARRRFLKYVASTVAIAGIGGLMYIVGRNSGQPVQPAVQTVQSYTRLSDLIDGVSTSQGGSFEYTMTNELIPSPVPGKDCNDSSFVIGPIARLLVDSNGGEISSKVDLSMVDLNKGGYALLQYQYNTINGSLVVYQNGGNFLPMGLPFYLQGLTHAINPQFDKRIKYRVRDHSSTQIIFDQTVEG